MEDEESRTVFVGGLNDEIDEKLLYELFLQVSF